MNRRLLPLAALAFALSATAQYAPTASTDVYDISAYGSRLLDLFYDALQQGRRYPTVEEFEAAGFNGMDMHFVRSHVRPRPIIDATPLVASVTPTRKLWMNVPIGIGGEGGYPNTNFSDDTFTGWNYTAVFGAWNHGIFHVPAAATDAAHRNGTDIYSGIKFFDTTGASGTGDNAPKSTAWVNLISTPDPHGYEGFKYVEPMVNALMFFGQDGWQYNWEDTGYNKPSVVAFHQACQRLAAERGYDNFHIGIYTSSPQITASNCEALLGKAGQRTCDAFLNYVANDFASGATIANSVDAAKRNFGSTDGCYQGTWIVTMRRSWPNLNYVNSRTGLSAKEMNVVLWGEHNVSRLHSNVTGNTMFDYVDNYQKLQERFFSGGYRNPAIRPAETAGADWQTADESTTALRNFQGLSHYIPERSAIQQSLPFTTHFSIGSGERYNYRGRRTGGSWYNLAQQDVVPTYRWLVYRKGSTTPVKDGAGLPELTGDDAYTGGSCLRLNSTADADLVLYHTALSVTSTGPKATIALKRHAGAPAGSISLIVRRRGSSEWLETPFRPISGNTWQEQTVSLEGIGQGDVIEYVGLRTTGDVGGLLVGLLSISDDSRVTPADIHEPMAEVKEETQTSLSVKLCWDVDAPAVDRADYGLLYNDEADIDHFEILYKDGAEGRASEVARTSNWAAYVGNIAMTPTTDPWLGVRTASVDGQTYGPVHWLHIARAAADQVPETSPTAGLYPPSTLNQWSEGADQAIVQRYVTRVAVPDADEPYEYVNTTGTPYTRDLAAGLSTDDADKNNYILADDVLHLHQGQHVNVTLDYYHTEIRPDGKAYNDQGLVWCTGRGYVDWDGDHNFNGGNDEVVWAPNKSKAGESSLKTMPAPSHFSIDVPDDATPGESRLRFVFSDAWFPHPGPAGMTSKGFSLDIPVVITGSNPARAIAADTHDTGVADEPVALVDATSSITAVTTDALPTARLEGRTLHVSGCDKVWVIDAAGRLVAYTTSAAPVSLEGRAPGVYLVRMQQGRVMRTARLLMQ